MRGGNLTQGRNDATDADGKTDRLAPEGRHVYSSAIRLPPHSSGAQYGIVMHGSIRMGWVPQPMYYFTTLFYLTAPCGLANPQGFHGSGLDLSIQVERAVGQIIALYPTYDSETHHTRRLGILPTISGETLWASNAFIGRIMSLEPETGSFDFAGDPRIAEHAARSIMANRGAVWFSQPTNGSVTRVDAQTGR